MLISATLQVAFVCPSPEDRNLLAALLAQLSSPACVPHPAGSAEEARALIASGLPDAYLLHHHFACGPNALLGEAIATGRPVLVLLDEDDAEAENALVDAGAWGTIIVAQATPAVLRNALRTAVEHFRQIATLESAERDLRHALSMLRTTFETTVDGVVVTDRSGRVLTWNRRLLEMWQIPEALLANGHALELADWAAGQVEDPESLRHQVKSMTEGLDAEGTAVIRLKNGRVFERVTIPQRVGGEVVGRVWSFHDLTERELLESQLRHSQKMEAVGRLAGGVAHDFNNLLTAIIGYAEMLRDEFSDDDPRKQDVGEIHSAAQRATALTRQLLTFSRRQQAQLRTLDVNEVVQGFAGMVSRVIGEDVKLEMRLAPTLRPVKADPGQLEQVLMNLAVNARDAMPNGGCLTVSTENVELDEAYARTHASTRPGPYVKLQVSDEGTGMTPEVLSHAFEPFFTTKEKGKGTGLGLATVYGIVQQSGGHIGVESAPGRGTTFTIMLPAL